MMIGSEIRHITNARIREWLHLAEREGCGWWGPLATNPRAEVAVFCKIQINNSGPYFEGAYWITHLQPR